VEYVPLEHRLQLTILGIPVPLENVPALQYKQTLETLAPEAVAYRPGPHESQAKDPLEEPSTPFPYVPAMHKEQVLKPFPVKNVPDLHKLQLLGATAPLPVQNFPELQYRQAQPIDPP